MSLEHHPLHAAFLLIAEEYDRSVREHHLWCEAGHSDKVMLKVIKAEVAELDLAIEMDDTADTLTEAVHVANVGSKMVAELLRRKG